METLTQVLRGDQRPLSLKHGIDNAYNIDGEWYLSNVTVLKLTDFQSSFLLLHVFL